MARQPFDVVIVGGGSAGAVLAARLSAEVHRHVLLLEAGPNFTPDTYPSVLRDANVVAGSPDFDWHYTTEDAARLGHDRGAGPGGKSDPRHRRQLCDPQASEGAPMAGPASPRWTFHFTPTSASWLNAVEGFFSKLTRRRLKRGVFRSVVDLQVAISRFVAETNADPKPFVWTADPKRVLAAVKRGKQTLESLH